MNGQLKPEQILPQVEKASTQEQADLSDSRKFIEANQTTENTPVANTILPDTQTENVQLASEQIILAKVESILASDMEKIFLSMDIASQAQFKAKGEEVALAITDLLQKTQIQINKVISLIMDWLRLIPNVNKYYLEQEAKLKADALLRVYKENGTNHH